MAKAKCVEENLAVMNGIYLPYFQSSRHFLGFAFGCALALSMNFMVQPEPSNKDVVGQVEDRSGFHSSCSGSMAGG